MTTLERRIRLAAILVILGLVVEGVSFLWSSPLAFFLFLIGACGLAAAGIAIYLASLITVGHGAAAAAGAAPPAAPAPPPGAPEGPPAVTPRP